MKSINQNAPVKSSKLVKINANKKKVWKVLIDIDNWSNWQTDIKKSKINGALKPKVTFDWKTGGVNIHSTIHTVNFCSEFGWTGKAFGAYAIHNWKLTESNQQTIISVEESMDGFLTKLFKKSFQKQLENGMQKWLNLLKLECEK